MTKNYILHSNANTMYVIIELTKEYSYALSQYIKEYLEVQFDEKDGRIVEWRYRLLTSLDDTLARFVAHPEYYIPEEIVDFAKIQCVRNLKNRLSNIRKGQKMPQWKALKTIADSILVNFKNDFYKHDALEIFQKNPIKFIWIVERSHTRIFCEKGGDSWNSLSYDLKYNDSTKFFWYENGQVKEIERSQVKDFYNLL